jgi:hypothetical protein
MHASDGVVTAFDVVAFDGVAFDEEGDGYASQNRRGSCRM